MRGIWLTLMIATGCPGDSGVKVHNDEPEVTILEPIPGSSFAAGALISAEATVIDDDASEDLSVVWASSIDGELEGELLDERATLTAVSLSSGTEHLLLQLHLM